MKQKVPEITQLILMQVGLSSGVYFYQLTTDNFTSTKKFTLMK